MYVKLGTVRILNIPLDIAPMPVSFIVRKTTESSMNLALLRESFVQAANPAGPALQPSSLRHKAGKPPIRHP
jgi:hypothetical protein